MRPDLAHVPAGWREALDRLAAESWSRLVVIGAGDRGKSTFCDLLAAELSAAGETVQLLDTDLGQKHVGPPACVTLGAWGEGWRLQAMHFVGITNPVGAMAGVVAGSARLAGRAGADRLIVNTSGLVRGPGVALKRWKLDALQPEQIIALSLGEDLAALRPVLPPARVAWLEPSPQARAKGEGRRSQARGTAMAEALAGASDQLLTGVAVDQLGREPPASEERRLAGLSDAAGETLGIGVAEVPPPGAETLAVRTKVDPARVWRVQLGMPVPDTAPPDAG